jgi:histidinol-phosphatase (PHP family)
VATAIDCGFTHVNYLAHDEHGAVQMRQVALDTL